MRRSVHTRLSFTAQPGLTQVALMIAVARVQGIVVEEQWQVRMDGAYVDVLEVEAPHRGRIHLLELAVRDQTFGNVQVEYSANVRGDATALVRGNPEPTAADLLTYSRPSRYAESDILLPTAQQLFAGLAGVELVHAVAEYAYESLRYAPGSSRFTDGAVQTLLSRRGVCRDYAHLVVGLLRGLDVPARLAAVYAPGLVPMDFHAVAEAWVEGHWHAVDATRLAPRSAMLRISTGRDAADTAFLSSHGAGIEMTGQSVVVTTDGDLPEDDHTSPFLLP